MNKIIVTGVILITVSIALFTGISLAQTDEDEKLQKRIQGIQKIIDIGISTGQITNDEAEKFQTNLDVIKTEIEQLKEQGKLTVEERVRLHKELDKLNQPIQKKKIKKHKTKAVQ